MTAYLDEGANAPLSLIERKQRAARTRIVEAADQLFAERGFDNVSVTDIATRAEVGRTTFFRHFGDKTEVVFAKEQAMVNAVTEVTSGDWTRGQAVDTLVRALRALEPLVLELCRRATADLTSYQRHILLVSEHVELRAREALKHQEIAQQLASALRLREAPWEVATLAAHIAVACYTSGRILATDTATLPTKTREAFEYVLTAHDEDANN